MRPHAWSSIQISISNLLYPFTFYKCVRTPQKLRVSLQRQRRWVSKTKMMTKKGRRPRCPLSTCSVHVSCSTEISSSIAVKEPRKTRVYKVTVKWGNKVETIPCSLKKTYIRPGAESIYFRPHRMGIVAVIVVINCHQDNWRGIKWFWKVEHLLGQNPH